MATKNKIIRPHKRSPKTRSGERGNVFLFVILGIALFATLAYVVSRGLRSETTSNLTKQQVRLAAADTLSYAQKLEIAVSRIRRKNVSENDISFVNNVVAGYAHAQPDKHKVFHLSGGGMTWRSPYKGVNNGSEWLFTGETCIGDVGTGAAGCESDTDDSNEELLAILQNLNESVCTEINAKLNIGTTPQSTGVSYSSAQFTGTYQDGYIPDNMDGYSAGCFEADGSQAGFHFYQVLIER